MGNNYINMKVNGETAIKPYYYLRNRLLHIRYVVDRCVELSPEEERKVKAELGEYPYDKQETLSRAWEFMTKFVKKKIITDGCVEAKKRIDPYGQKNKISDIQ